jgi:hypothetical protein
VRIISERECKVWLCARLEQPFDWNRTEGIYGCAVTYLLPRDVGRRTALGRTLSSLVNCSGESLFWITEWGVFPSCENNALFDGYRRSLSENRPLHEAPGHLFEQGDRESFECLLDIALYFFWDASIFDAGGVWVQFNHDEVLSIRARDERSIRSWITTVRLTCMVRAVTTSRNEC